MANHSVSSNFLFTMYTTSWCGDCFRIKNFLDKRGLKNGIDYQEINIEENTQALQTVEDITGGYRSVPTLIFSDKSILVEPSIHDLETKLKPLLMA